MRILIILLFIINSFYVVAQEWSVYTKQVSPVGNFIAVSKDSIAHIYALTSDELKFKFSMGTTIAGTGFSKDERVLAAMDYNYVFRAFDILTGEELWSTDILEMIDLPKKRLLVRVAFSESGNFILFQHGSQSIVLDRYNGELVGFDDFGISALFAFKSGEPVQVWSIGPDSFEVVASSWKEYVRVDIKVEENGFTTSRRDWYKKGEYPSRYDKLRGKKLSMKGLIYANGVIAVYDRGRALYYVYSVKKGKIIVRGDHEEDFKF